MSYCAICGGTGIKLDGSLCDCKSSLDNIFEGTICVDVPTQYQGIVFNSDLVPSDISGGYAKFLQKTYDDITSLRFSKNIAICSPAGHSKTVLAYSCIQNLFRKKIQIAPLLDVMEIRTIMADIDMGKSEDYAVLDAPYLFVKIPLEASFQMYATISLLLDRRVRRGKYTIFLYNGPWSDLVYTDNRSIMKSLAGDGSFMTIENNTWRLFSETTASTDCRG